MNEKCYGCAAADQCPTACQYESIMCTMKRMQSGQTKGQLMRRRGEYKTHCPACGQLVREMGIERFCNNVKCIERYKPL